MSAMVVRQGRDRIASDSLVRYAIRRNSRFVVSECDDHEALIDLIREEPLDLVVVSSDLHPASRVRDLADMVRGNGHDAATRAPHRRSGGRGRSVACGCGCRLPGWRCPRGCCEPRSFRSCRTPRRYRVRPSRPTPVAIWWRARRTRSPATPRRSDAYTLSSSMFARSLERGHVRRRPDGRILAGEPRRVSSPRPRRSGDPQSGADPGSPISRSAAGRMGSESARPPAGFSASCPCFEVTGTRVPGRGQLGSVRERVPRAADSRRLSRCHRSQTAG